ncbi:hypothetical protein PTTG_25500, partial [Puccinia triticina 1-1 BBBD Race 1]
TACIAHHQGINTGWFVPGGGTVSITLANTHSANAIPHSFQNISNTVAFGYPLDCQSRAYSDPHPPSQPSPASHIAISSMPKYLGFDFPLVLFFVIIAGVQMTLGASVGPRHLINRVERNDSANLPTAHNPSEPTSRRSHCTAENHCRSY